ncbi:hypothetical protein LX70_02979 [Defluviimonas denitrificans]|jgi:hypothetical protein|uniref:Uncharacterized protein n=1 Tax=Albidovulum denitrificans TaxID=404881 RepID=A0A2S8S4J3_9RHOB|nr:hypothetical protein [Defluviimonas denitrificans]PQV55658.1 hypothetical protein LX70_02979 [Defluviimonas denitrificans]
MSLTKVVALARDVVVAGAKGFWKTPVDTSKFVPLNRGAKHEPGEDGLLIARAMAGDSSVISERPDIWAAYGKKTPKD